MVRNVVYGVACLSVLLLMVINLLEMDIFCKDAPWRRYDQGKYPVCGRSADYPSGVSWPAHNHPTAQLIHAVCGVMVVTTESGSWTVPPTRGVWVPAGTTHTMRTVGEVHLRTLYIRSEAGDGLPGDCQVVAISPLLRELILAALEVVPPYAPDSREGRLMALVLDEVGVLPCLPLRLPFPSDPLLVKICSAISAFPGDSRTLSDWAVDLAVDARTIQRRFARQTGMTFGRWRQQARLCGSLELLASGAKVVDVALALGYDSPSAFATMFRRQFGSAPSDYYRQRG